MSCLGRRHSVELLKKESHTQSAAKECIERTIAVSAIKGLVLDLFTMHILCISNIDLCKYLINLFLKVNNAYIEQYAIDANLHQNLLRVIY